MNIVITVSRNESRGLVCGLTRACRRNNVDYSLFFTGAGIGTLDDAAVIECSTFASEAIACEFSWEEQRAREQCPVEIGSQTDHSRLLKTADRLVTL